ncbi:hypothetical protein [Microbacterium sp.]|uniref:hypothetical protein n=1 Tax=Microbacterium sp. TaxID=51671 RepID=UPI003A847FF4
MPARGSAIARTPVTRDERSWSITNHGRPVARLVLIRPSVLDELLADGGARAALTDQPRASLPPASTSTATSDELIADVRGYERDY